MRKNLPLLLFLLVTTFIFDQVYAQCDAWTQKANLSTGRYTAAGFSIGNKGYIGTGYDGSSGLQDFWEYNSLTETWTQKADFGGGARWGARGFSLGNSGYIGIGYDGTNNLIDFWKYDTTLNTWIQRADFSGTGRRFAVDFTLNGKGYIGTGYINSGTNDLWEYDPIFNSWAQKANFPGTARHFAAGFSLGNKGYLGTGNDGGFTKDFWEYDPILDSWTQKIDFPGTARNSAVGFSINDKGYLGTGSYSGIQTKDIWEYDPSTDTWTQRTDFGGTARTSTIAFSINDRGYIGAGYDGSSVLIDLWEYTLPGPTVDTISSTNIGTCNGDSIGTITITASANTSIIYYSIDSGSNYQNTTGLFTGLIADGYDIFVQDELGCTDTGGTIIITEPLPINIDSVKSTNVLGCYGDSTATITISASANQGILYFSIDSGNSYPDTTGIFTMLMAGNYYTIVQDSNGCINSVGTIIITSPQQINIDSITSTDVVGCFGNASGTIIVSASGGTGGLDYSIDSGATYLNTTGIFTGINGGLYDIIVKDSNDCIQTANTLTVNGPAPITIDLTSSTPDTSFGGVGTASVSINGGTPPYTLFWFPSGQTDTIAIGLTSGTYLITIQDSNSCSYMDSVYIDNFTGIINSHDAGNTVRIYPNPTSGILNISIADPGSNKIGLSIFDITGKTVAEREYDLDHLIFNQSLKITGLPKGIYYISIRTDQMVSTKKVVIK